MRLRVGQVIVAEQNAKSWFSRAIGRHTHSRVSHAAIYVGDGYMVQALVPKVTLTPIRDFFDNLASEDRAYAVMDLAGVGLLTRAKVAMQAKSYVGRYYDIGQALLYAATNHFWNDGTGTLLCSRIITAAYWSGAGINLFPGALLDDSFPVGDPHRSNLADGYATPHDFFRSRLEVVRFHASATSPTVEALSAPLDN